MKLFNIQYSWFSNMEMNHKINVIGKHVIPQSYCVWEPLIYITVLIFIQMVLVLVPVLRVTGIQCKSKNIPSKEGIIMYMLVCVCRWFAGRVSRLEAEKRLRWQDTGVFLVRESESAPGEFSVSVRSVNAPHTDEMKRLWGATDWRNVPLLSVPTLWLLMSL